MTGDRLFIPRILDSRLKVAPMLTAGDDHLAQIVELIGFPSAQFLDRSCYAKDFFHNPALLKRAGLQLQSPLFNILIKYGYSPSEAKVSTLFLESCLRWEPAQRITASEATIHPFTF